MKAKQLRGILMQAVFSWLNNSRFNGTDTGGRPVVLEVVDSTAKSMIVEVRSGHAASTEAHQYKVTVKVEKL